MWIISLCPKIQTHFEKYEMLTLFLPIFVATTKIILDYNFEAPPKISQNSQGNTCAGVLFHKDARPELETSLKRDFCACVFQ